tara:strand:- start:911 stop:1177 length:267 start_codon:yes stop_codon:yes gene_type:complete
MLYPEDYNNQKNPQLTKKFCLKKSNEFVQSIRLEMKQSRPSLSYSLTSVKDEALQFCTKVAALSIILSIEHHLTSGFTVSEEYFGSTN